MKILIIGAGKVGYSLAENLSKEGNDVTIIDNDLEELKKAEENLDVMCIKGNGASTKILLEAGISNCDLLIAVTTSDERNIVCCLTGKKLGAAHTIARIRDLAYAHELSLVKADLGLDMVINPEQATAYEIARLLSFPSATNIESFAKGKVNLIEVKVTHNLDSIIGKRLKDISDQISCGVLIGAVKRGKDVTIPDGDFTVEEGDMIYAMGKPSSVFNFCKLIGKKDYKIKTVTILGGGIITYHLTKIISEMDMKVRIIEYDEARCLGLEEMLPDTQFICGSRVSEELTECPEIINSDAFVTLTEKDEDNIIYALLAEQLGIQKVIAKVTRINYSNVIKGLGVDTLVNQKLTTTNQILRYVRGLKNAYTNTISSLYKIIGDQVEVVEFFANEYTKFLNTPLEKLNIANGVLVAAIVRKNEIIIPKGKDYIKYGDSVIIIAKNKNYSGLNDIFFGGSLHNEIHDSIKKLGDNINI